MADRWVEEQQQPSNYPQGEVVSQEWLNKEIHQLAALRNMDSYVLWNVLAFLRHDPDRFQTYSHSYFPHIVDLGCISVDTGLRKDTTESWEL